MVVRLPHYSCNTSPPVVSESGPRKTKRGVVLIHRITSVQTASGSVKSVARGCVTTVTPQVTASTYGTRIGNIGYNYLSVHVILYIEITTISAAGGDTCNNSPIIRPLLGGHIICF